jgi:hypothetical protein
MTLSINETAINCAVVMLCVTLFYCYAECHDAECRYAECNYAECCYAECNFDDCHGAFQ